MKTRFIRILLFSVVALSTLLFTSAQSFARVGVLVTVAPPPLPVYEQPPCPGDGYLWTPGYWAWGDDFDDYYWVPGTWIVAPEIGFLWTPGWWGWDGGGFVFYDGYWGPQIGFYGGIDYGFGYFGVGFEGGRWDNGHFFYNRSVTNVNVTEIHNVYNTTVNHATVNHVAYNGGKGGINARPTAAEEAAARDRHIAPIAAQTQHAEQARSNPQQRASENMGKPPVAATPKPGDFKDHGVVAAREAGAPYTPSAKRGSKEESSQNRGENSSRPTTAVHPRDLPPLTRSEVPTTGNAKVDKKNQQAQEKQFAKQQKERQKLEKQQEKEDAQAAKRNASEASRQQVEQRHQQQTQQLQQRHMQEQQQLQQRQAPSRPAPPRR